MGIRGLEDADDVRAIARQEVRAWRAAYDGIVADHVLAGLDPEPSDERATERLEAWRSEAGAFLVADDEEAVVGDDEAGLKAIYVDPERWGAGVGTALLKRGIEELPDSIRRVRLETLADNEPAKRFYEASGFEPTGETAVEIADESYPAVVYALER